MADYPQRLKILKVENTVKAGLLQLINLEGTYMFKLKILIFSLLFIPGHVMAAPFAYVPNERAGTISIIDVETDQVVHTMKAGIKPRGITLHPTEERLYVSDGETGKLLVIDRQIDLFEY